MMMQFFRNRAAKTLAPNEAAVGDRLPYLGHLDEVTIQTRDGLLVQTIHLRGFPFETSSDDELNYRKAMRETLLRGAASSRLAIYHHVVRRKVNTEIDSAPDNAFCRRLDDAWRARLSRRQLYVNEIFLTLVRRPLRGGAGFIEKTFEEAGRGQGAAGARIAPAARHPRNASWRRSRRTARAPCRSTRPHRPVLRTRRIPVAADQRRGAARAGADRRHGPDACHPPPFLRLRRHGIQCQRQ
ncbi:MAG: hypothetical protein U1E93_00090 [Alphaproteobacteria bacterium]